MIERSAIVDGIRRTALYSADAGGPDGFGDYRYSLRIEWQRDLLAQDRGLAQFCLLNPSTANHLGNDPTVTRCCGYARRWGYRGCIVTNISAWRATDPLDMVAAPFPIGEANTPEFMAGIKDVGLVVAGWGAWGGCEKLRAQAAAVRAAFGERLHALKLTKLGEPQHLLYLRGDLEPRPLAELDAEAAA